MPVDPQTQAVLDFLAASRMIDLGKQALADAAAGLHSAFGND